VVDRDGGALAALRWGWRVDEKGERGGSQQRFTADFVDWMTHHPSHIPFIAEMDDGDAHRNGPHPVGMAWLAILERIPGPERWRRLSGSLQSVYVLPSHRDRGIGARLVDAALADARDRGLEYLIVHPSEPAFSLYRRAGFAETPKLLELRFGTA
jgi:GNAT superfamily N-acetyltransferase